MTVIKGIAKTPDGGKELVIRTSNDETVLTIHEKINGIGIEMLQEPRKTEDGKRVEFDIRLILYSIQKRDRGEVHGFVDSFLEACVTRDDSLLRDSKGIGIRELLTTLVN